jgi:hypothetical protein
MGFPWKKILGIGANVAAAVTGIGAINLIPEIVVSVEQIFHGQPGSGETKKAVVLQMALLAICAAEGISKRDLINNEQAMDALDDMIEAAVKMNNAIHWKKAA